MKTKLKLSTLVRLFGEYENENKTQTRDTVNGVKDRLVRHCGHFATKQAVRDFFASNYLPN